MRKLIIAAATAASLGTLCLAGTATAQAAPHARPRAVSPIAAGSGKGGTHPRTGGRDHLSRPIGPWCVGRQVFLTEARTALVRLVR